MSARHQRPWAQQSGRKCGFFFAGTQGTLSSDDVEDHVSVRTRSAPAPRQVSKYLVVGPARAAKEHSLNTFSVGDALRGPLDASIVRVGPQVPNTACAAAKAGRTLEPRGQVLPNSDGHCRVSARVAELEAPALAHRPLQQTH